MLKAAPRSIWISCGGGGLTLLHQCVCQYVLGLPSKLFVPGASSQVVSWLSTNSKLHAEAFCTVRLAVFVTPPLTPEIVTEAETGTRFAVTVKLALVAPAGTVTELGTVTAMRLPLDSVTGAPPLGAAPLKVTIPCPLLPAVSEVGFKVTDESVGTVTAVPITLISAADVHGPPLISLNARKRTNRPVTAVNETVKTGTTDAPGQVVTADP